MLATHTVAMVAVTSRLISAGRNAFFFLFFFLLADLALSLTAESS